MAMTIDLTPQQLFYIDIFTGTQSGPATDPLLDGDAQQVLDGDGNPIFGWQES